MRDSLRAISEELEGARCDGTTAVQCRDLGAAARHATEAARLVELAAYSEYLAAEDESRDCLSLATHGRTRDNEP